MIWTQQHSVSCCRCYFHGSVGGRRADGWLPFWLRELEAGEDVVCFPRWRLIKTGWGPRTGKTDVRVWCSINTARLQQPGVYSEDAGGQVCWMLRISRCAGQSVCLTSNLKASKCRKTWTLAARLRPSQQRQRQNELLRVSRTQINSIKSDTDELMTSSVFTSVKQIFYWSSLNCVITRMIFVGFRVNLIKLIKYQTVKMRHYRDDSLS